jgi:hypothetical protein
MLEAVEKIRQKSEYTFKHNKSLGRHGWLRLTPAYSVKLVEEILNNYENNELLVFDPFSGTGTTGIVAAEKGYNAISFDINPFLIWLANQKGKNYSEIEIKNIVSNFRKILANTIRYISKDNWIPDIFNINRWWDKNTLKLLSAIRASMVEIIGESRNSNEFSLIWIAFCRLIIETSSAAFNHVSMSFKDSPIEYEEDYLFNLFDNILEIILTSTKKKIIGDVKVMYGDSRLLAELTNIDLVITSPPYPNRISYIRELRPYMYWMKYIEKTSESGDIDWEAIGGTWGSATSKLITWEPDVAVNSKILSKTICDIESTGQKNSKLMSIYVHKYFHDINLHINNLYRHLNREAQAFYIIGNSSFFGVHVDSDILYKEMFERSGFSSVTSRIIRKRNCNKSLFEYCVSAVKK